MDYVEAYADVLEKLGVLEITIGMMELFPGMKEDSQKAKKSIRETKVFIEKGEWISAVCSLDGVNNLYRNYLETLPLIKLRDDYTRKSLEENIAAVEGFLSRQIRKEAESCPDTQRTSKPPKQTSVIKLRKSLRLRS